MHLVLWWRAGAGDVRLYRRPHSRVTAAQSAGAGHGRQRAVAAIPTGGCRHRLNTVSLKHRMQLIIEYPYQKLVAHPANQMP